MSSNNISPSLSSSSGGFGSTTIEPETNTQIKRRFENAIQYFTKMVEIILLSMDGSFQEDDKKNFGVSSHHFVYSEQSTPTLKPIIKSTNNNNIHNNSLIDRTEDPSTHFSDDRLMGSSGDEHDPFEYDGIEDEAIPPTDIFLSRPENQDVIMNLTKGFWKRSYKYRENLYFSLSSVQDSLLVEQLIDQSFNNFVDDCYHEIINKFENISPSIIDLLKLSRGSPEKVFGAPRLERHTPLFRNPDASPEHRNDIQTLFRYIWRRYFQFNVIISFLISLFPIAKWIKTYKLDYLKDDVIASLTIGFMLIPQAMSYAILANLPPIYGLYSAFISPIIYGIFGTSNEISVGPVAMVSLLVPSIIDKPAGTPEYIVDAICLSLLSGLILFTFGLLKVGFIIETLLSNPILLGFIQAGSILIMFSQIKNLTAIPISSKATNVIDFMDNIVHNIRSIHWATVIMAVVAIILLLVARHINTKIKYKIPMPILVLTFGTLISYLVDAHNRYGIKIVDTIPSGIPKPSPVPLDLARISRMFVGAVILSILGFVESISIGKKFSSLRKYSIDSSQELIALGLCNIIQSVFQAYPSTGSFSRTAVAYQSGSKSRLTSILTGIIVMIVLLLLTPVFKYTPLCLLAAIVIVAAVGLFEPRETIDLYKHGELMGFFQLIFVFLCTLMLGSETGIVIAFCTSILQIIFFSSRPNLVTLGRLPGTFVYRNVRHYPNAITHSGISIVRYDSRMVFYTINYFRDSMNALNLTDGTIKVIIIDAVNVSSIDSTALDVLNDMLDFYGSNGILVLWSDLRNSVRAVMKQSGFLKRISTDHIFASTSAAVEYAVAENKLVFEMLVEP